LYVSVQGSIWEVRFPRTISQISLVNLCWSPRRGVVHHEGMCYREGIPWFVQIDEHNIFMVGTIVGVVSLQK